MQRENKKSKGWCFTLNNYSEFELVDVENLSMDPNVQYIVWGKEKGQLGTPHLQGFVRFKNAFASSKIRNALPRAHVEIQRGTNQQAADYCKKDGEFTEIGELPIPPGETTKAKWKEIIALAEKGDLDTIRDEFPHVYLMHRPKLLSLRKYEPLIINEIQNEWWYGSTGTGKSKKLWDDFPDHYPKALNKWWDGYDNEDIVAIEEINPKSAEYLAHFIKIWADRYPFSPEIKGGTLKKIRPKKIIVLSNYTIEECFPHAQDQLPIKRRFKPIHFVSL